MNDRPIPFRHITNLLNLGSQTMIESSIKNSTMVSSVLLFQELYSLHDQDVSPKPILSTTKVSRWSRPTETCQEETPSRKPFLHPCEGKLYRPLLDTLLVIPSIFINFFLSLIHYRRNRSRRRRQTSSPSFWKPQHSTSLCPISDPLNIPPTTT